MTKVFVGVVAAAAIIAACSSDNTTATPPVVASVTMVPALDTALGGDTMLVIPTAQLAAVLKDANGRFHDMDQQRHSRGDRGRRRQRGSGQYRHDTGRRRRYGHDHRQDRRGQWDGFNEGEAVKLVR